MAESGVTCPNCLGQNVQQHSKAWWCLRCGWGKNKFPDPSTGRPTENPGRPWSQP